jgi:hypothetical protein
VADYAPDYAGSSVAYHSVNVAHVFCCLEIYNFGPVESIIGKIQTSKLVLSVIALDEIPYGNY